MIKYTIEKYITTEYIVTKSDKLLIANKQSTKSNEQQEKISD